MSSTSATDHWFPVLISVFAAGFGAAWFVATEVRVPPNYVELKQKIRDQEKQVISLESELESEKQIRSSLETAWKKRESELLRDLDPAQRRYKERGRSSNHSSQNLQEHFPISDYTSDRYVLENGADIKVFNSKSVKVYLHKNNPLSAVNNQILEKVYGRNGKLTNWSDLGVTIPGCMSDEIVLVSLQSTNEGHKRFKKHVLNNGKFKMGTLDMYSSEDVRDLVEKTPCAIGYN